MSTKIKRGSKSIHFQLGCLSSKTFVIIFNNISVIVCKDSIFHCLSGEPSTDHVNIMNPKYFITLK